MNNMSIVSDFFTIQYGQKEYESKSRLKAGKTPLISSTGKNNGFYGFYDIEPKFINVISFPRTGSIGEARVHDYPCCIDGNCLVLTPRKEMSPKQLFYSAFVLRGNKWRFKYGRQATEKRISNFKLPLMKEIEKLWTPPTIKTENVEIDLTKLLNELNGEWLGHLFEIVKGEGLYFGKCKAGKTPMISASEINNGVIGFVDMSPLFKAPCITMERIRAKAHVQTVDFVTVPDDLFVLKPKRDFTVGELFFIASILNMGRWRFNYHLKVTKPRLERMKFLTDKEEQSVQILLDQGDKSKVSSTDFLQDTPTI